MHQFSCGVGVNEKAQKVIEENRLTLLFIELADDFTFLKYNPVIQKVWRVCDTTGAMLDKEDVKKIIKNYEGTVFLQKVP